MKQITHPIHGGRDSINLTYGQPGKYSQLTNHFYEVYPSNAPLGVGQPVAAIQFQDGPIHEAHIDGVHNEDLILIVIDRLQGFQDSPYACRENALALTRLEEALLWLRQRTEARRLREVEGTSTV